MSRAASGSRDRASMAESSSGFAVRRQATHRSLVFRRRCAATMPTTTAATAARAISTQIHVLLLLPPLSAAAGEGELGGAVVTTADGAADVETAAVGVGTI